MRKRNALLLFALAVAMLLGVLKGVNRLPGVIRGDLMKKYDSLEDAKTGAGLGRVLIPSYMPQDLKWPPATVLAQGTPFPALVLEFERSAGGEVVLVISQSASSALRLEDKIRFARVTERARYALKGRDALLEVGVEKGGKQCSRLSWNEKGGRIVVLSASSPFEAIKVAESMLP